MTSHIPPTRSTRAREAEALPPRSRAADATRPPRLRSVDALRGLTVAAMLLVNDAGDWAHVHPWLAHADWHGVNPPDFIFPLFLLIVGVSVELSLGARADAGVDRRALAGLVLQRALRLVLLGLALNVVSWLFMSAPGRELRWPGVLQRIGLCYAAVGLVALHLRSPRAQWGLFGVLLIGHSVALWAGGSLERWHNLSDRIDTLLLGAHAYLVNPISGGSHDPEGVLGTVTAVASALVGLRAGAWLRQGKPGRLLPAAAALLLAGAAASPVLPLNKSLWTATFVLCSAGTGLLLLALAHGAVDRLGAPPLGESLGVNAISAYALAWVVAVALEASGAGRWLYASAFAAPLHGLPPWVPSAAWAAVFTAVFWIGMRWLQRRGWRITI